MEILKSIQNLSIQPVAVLITIGVCMCFGAFWYSPRVFGNIWAKALYGESAEMKGNPLQYLGATIVSAVMVICIAIFLSAFKILEVQQGMLWAFVAWLAFIATSHFSGVIWGKKPLQVYFIDVFYLLLAILVSTTLLIILRK